MQGYTAFMIACGSGNVACMELLLAAREYAGAVAPTPAAALACRQACIHEKTKEVHTTPEHAPSCKSCF